MIIVLDTNVWVNALTDSGNKKYYVSSYVVLASLLQNNELFLGIDYDEVIIREYQDNVGENEHYQMFMRHLGNACRFWKTNGRISPKIKKNLLERGFHEAEDQTFVATALSSGKYIISDDGDYGTHGEPEKQRANDYIKNTLGIRLENTEEGAKSLKREE